MHVTMSRTSTHLIDGILPALVQLAQLLAAALLQLAQLIATAHLQGVAFIEHFRAPLRLFQLSRAHARALSLSLQTFPPQRAQHHARALQFVFHAHFAAKPHYCLYIRMNVHVYVCILICVYMYVCIDGCMDGCRWMKIYRYIRFSVSLFLCFSVSISLCFSVSISLCLSASRSVSVHLPTHPHTDSPTHLSTHTHTCSASN